ncbi:hypothetical protein WAF17_13505 [Bernardetia sp. ABR2-2B]|uniref:hypothetical protein n=1 Tax=Bernardetia sp. ABR2-2B TaxID=3127472 RepID=UPI0030D61458
MRYLYAVLFVVFLTTFYSCTSSTETKETKTEETENVASVNWNDTTAMGKVINRLYEDSLLTEGNIAMKIKDPFMRGAIPYRFVQIQKILRPRFKKVSSTVGYMPVLMTTSKDSVIVDFQMTWKDGKFVVTDRFLQKVGTQPRYEWVENDEYWVRRDIIEVEK